MEKPQKIDEDNELVVIPMNVTRGKGLCKGEIFTVLMLMIVMWICTSVNY